MHKDLIRDRIKAAGEWIGVQISPDCLRHTYATQLLNVGCRVTTIQKLLGHRRPNSMMIYGQVHYHTVAADYYAAMARIEKCLGGSAGAGQALDVGETASTGNHGQLLTLLDQLTEPQISVEMRLELVGSAPPCSTAALPMRRTRQR